MSLAGNHGSCWGGFETYRTVRSQITNDAVRMVRNTGKNTRLLWVEWRL